MKTQRYLIFLFSLLAISLVFSVGCKDEKSSDKEKEEVSTTLPDSMRGDWQPTKESFRQIMEGEDIPPEVVDQLAENSIVTISDKELIFSSELMGEKTQDKKAFTVISATSEKTVVEITESDGSKSRSSLSLSGDTLSILENGDLIVLKRAKSKSGGGDSGSNSSAQPAGTDKAPSAGAAPSFLPSNMLGSWKPTLESYKEIMAGEDIPADVVEKLAAGATVEIAADKIIFHQVFMGEENKDSKPYKVISSAGGKSSLEITEADGSTTVSVVSLDGSSLLIEEGGTTIRFNRPASK